MSNKGCSTALALTLPLTLCTVGCGNTTGSCKVPDASIEAPGNGEVKICDLLSKDDPIRNFVSGGATCEDGTQCPSGFTCAEVSSQDSCFTAEDDEGCRCRPVAEGRLATGLRRLALQRGFGVGGMTTVVETAEVPPRLTWQAPKDARIVACALFSCSPSFVQIQSGCSPTDEVALFKIDNFDQCVLLFGAFPATQPGFVLGHENAYVASPSCPAPDETGARVVTELSAGCWAYDTTGIIAASELHPIRGSLLAGLPGLPQDGACTADWAACYDAAVDVFGVCLGGSCRPPCASPVDCSLGAPAPTPGGTCGWDCRKMSGQALGACVPAP
jgi:hypothetical protein